MLSETSSPAVCWFFTSRQRIRLRPPRVRNSSRHACETAQPVLTVPPDRVRVRHGDTGTTPLSSGTIGARGASYTTAAIAEAAGTSLDKAVKTTVFLADMGDFAAVNGVYAEYFKEPFPARSAIQVAALPLGADVEVEAVFAL